MTITTLHASAGQTTPQTLQTWLTQISHHFRYIMHSNILENHFTYLDPHNIPDLTHWPSGRVFGPHAQLQWQQKDPTTYRLAFLQENAPPPEPLNTLPHQTHQILQKTILHIPLWGEHKDNDNDPAGQPVWLENQIPRLLTYPIHTTSRQVALRLSQYTNTNTGHPAFIRYIDTTPWT